MNALIENLNLLGDGLLNFGWPMLWQSSVLIIGLFVIDLALRRRVRAAVRYALWLVILLKLLLPPSLALPTSLAWWLRPSDPPPAKAPARTFVVSYGNASTVSQPVLEPVQLPPTPPPKLSATAWMIVSWGVVSFGLLAWMLARWRHIEREVKHALPPPPWLNGLLLEVQHSVGMRRPVTLRLTNCAMSPAVCGFFRPAILLPSSLTETLQPAQLRAVLLHELIHLRRGDVWVNCGQALLQIFYWWHPLLWLANARIRRVREEAVDDAVMLTLRDNAETYAPTLLEVAKLAFSRPLASLGLVGILESRNALRQRIERLVNFRAPRKAGLTIASFACVVTFTALAVPMGEPPPSAAKEGPTVIPRGTSAGTATLNLNDNSAGSETLVTRTLKFDPEVFLPNLRRRMHLPDKGTESEVIVALPRFLADAGLELRPPCSFFFKERGLALFRAPQEKIEALERLFAELNDGRPQSEIPFPSPPPDQDTILRKLDQIRVDSPAYNETPLIEVVRDLSWEAKNRDTQKKGVAFFTKYSGRHGMVDLSAVKVTVSAVSNVRLSDLLDAIIKGADKPIQYHIWAGVEFYSTEDKPVLPMGMTIDETSTAKTNAAAPPVVPLTPAPTDGTASMSPSSGKEVESLYTRTFMISLDGFYKRTGLTRSSKPEEYQQGLLKLFSDAGVDLRPPKNMFFKDRQGLLLVRATLADLDAVERVAWSLNKLLTWETNSSRVAVEPLSEMPAKLETHPSSRDINTTNLLTRSFKLDPNTFLASLREASQRNVGSGEQLQQSVRDFFAKFGVDSKPPKAIFFNDRNGTLLVRATLPDMDAVESALQVLNYSPPQINIKAKFVEMPEAVATRFIAGLPTNNLGHSFSSGVLTDAQFHSFSTDVLTAAQSRKALQQLEAQDGVNILTTPEVTTLSGRQAQVQVVDMLTVVKGIKPQALVPPGVTSTNKNDASAYYQTESLSFGPVLDVMPTLEPDGYTITMDVGPTITEFMGYDRSTNSVFVYVNGKKESVGLPLPRFRIRQVTIHTSVRDGQTLVLGNPIRTEIFSQPNGEPRSTAIPEDSNKHLIVFVTTTIIDPAGNRVHTDKDMPFASKGVPPQKK